MIRLRTAAINKEALPLNSRFKKLKPNKCQKNYKGEEGTHASVLKR